MYYSIDIGYNNKYVVVQTTYSESYIGISLPDIFWLLEGHKPMSIYQARTFFADLVEAELFLDKLPNTADIRNMSTFIWLCRRERASIKELKNTMPPDFQPIYESFAKEAGRYQ